MSDKDKNTTDREPVDVPIAAQIAAGERHVKLILDDLGDLNRYTVEEVYTIVCERLGWEENPDGLRLMAKRIDARNGIYY